MKKQYNDSSQSQKTSLKKERNDNFKKKTSSSQDWNSNKERNSDKDWKPNKERNSDKDRNSDKNWNSNKERNSNKDWKPNKERNSDKDWKANKEKTYGKKFDKASKYSELPDYIKNKKNDKKVFADKDVRHNKFKKFSGDIDFESKREKKIIKRSSNPLVIKKNSKKDNDGIRLNKYISNAGVCSRREADTLISTGAVSINGKIVSELGTKVQPGDIVKVGDEKINPEKKIYVLLNKPKDYITTVEDENDRKTVMDLVKDACSERIYPVGRLDRNTTGLLLLTNDGEMATKLTHPSYNKKKIYHIFLETPVTAEHLIEIKNGIELDDGFIKADQVDFVNDSPFEVGIELHSGRNRIVRRIFEHFGYSITKLDRVYYAGLTKKDLPRGKWRFLTKTEINKLHSGMYV